VVVGATRPIADDLRERLGAHARWVGNGWDGPPPSAGPPPAPSAPARLVHTGSFSAGRDPAPLAAALDRVEGAVRVVLAGRRSPAADALLARDDVEDAGVLDRDAALALQRDADGLLLLTSRRHGEATGKLFEYLFAGRPIVALAAGNEAARIVEETATGVAVDPDDAEGIERALRRLAAGELAASYAPRELERFRYPAPARRMADALEEALAR
jgi:glycosyltransferase involved in cell wall biosynthesis